MTAPFFSTPRLSAVGLGRPIHAHTARIDERMRALVPDPSRVRAVLVGHSHCDHLMDVPYVARRYLPGVPVFGNAAMLRLLAGDPVHPRLASEEGAGSHRAPGRWVYPHPDSTVRYMALRSGHAPHALGVKVFRRSQQGEPGALPSNARELVEGEVLAYVVDFLDRPGGRVLFRVHFQDAASEAPLGFPPPLPSAESAPFDLAIPRGARIPGGDRRGAAAHPPRRHHGASPAGGRGAAAGRPARRPPPRGHLALRRAARGGYGGLRRPERPEPSFQDSGPSPDRRVSGSARD
jgi:hypothetical protein